MAAASQKLQAEHPADFNTGIVFIYRSPGTGDTRTRSQNGGRSAFDNLNWSSALLANITSHYWYAKASQEVICIMAKILIENIK